MVRPVLRLLFALAMLLAGTMPAHGLAQLHVSLSQPGFQAAGSIRFDRSAALVPHEGWTDSARPSPPDASAWRHRPRRPFKFP